MEKQDYFLKQEKSYGLTMSVYHAVQNANREQSTLKQLFSVELKQPDPQWKDKKNWSNYYDNIIFILISLSFPKQIYLYEMVMLFRRESLIYPRRDVIFTMKICFIPNSNHHTTNLHQTNYVILVFLKLRVLLLTDVRNVQCYFQLLIYVSYHVCLCFQILLVTILNLCYFSGSHQTSIS